MPEPQFHIIGADAVNPGIILLLDRSGSMQVETNGVSAAQFVQEAGLYLYHSTPSGQFVGAYVYNAGVDPLLNTPSTTLTSPYLTVPAKHLFLIQREQPILP